MSEFVKIGHRGAAGYEPENTIRSFIKAIKLGADAIEFDVRLSADKKVVIIHDATLDRTTNGRGLVNNFTHEELRRFDAGKGEKIPTLEQVFGVLGKGNPWGWKPSFHIELKETGIGTEVLSLIKRYHFIDSVIVSGFHTGNGVPEDPLRTIWDDLFTLKRSEPDLRIALLFERAGAFIKAINWPREFLPGRLKDIYAVNLSHRTANQIMVEAAHSRNIKVFVWTANNQNEIAYARKIGVDGIFSDYPDRL